MRRPAELLIFFFLIQVTSMHTTPADIIRPSSKILRVAPSKSLQISVFVVTSLLLGFLLGKVYARFRKGVTSKIIPSHETAIINSNYTEKAEKIGRLLVNHKYEKNF